jgi:hypothetical protein
VTSVGAIGEALGVGDATKIDMTAKEKNQEGWIRLPVLRGATSQMMFRTQLQR